MSASDLNPREPWKAFGITKGAYYKRRKKQIAAGEEPLPGVERLNRGPIPGPRPSGEDVWREAFARAGDDKSKPAKTRKSKREREPTLAEMANGEDVEEPEAIATDRDADTRPLPISDFVAYSLYHTYINRHTGDIWSSTAINARVRPVPTDDGRKVRANTWLDHHDAVEQVVWAPGLPQIITDRWVAAGGFFDKYGGRVFNLYKPPTIIHPADDDASFWQEHLYALWPDEAEHIEKWLAHRVQRPGEKINHALVLGGEPGVGKDAILEPLRHAVGAWNFADISPQSVLGSFNEFIQSVVLRISEGKDLGNVDRFAFYEATKTLFAAPPDTLRCNPKHLKPFYVLNVTGGIITTNHKASGLYLPADDRRHFVAWSLVGRTAYDGAYWARFWRRMNDGGADAVAAHLRNLNLAGFDAKAPPAHTQAFLEIVNAMVPEDETEMAEFIRALGLPDVLTIPRLKSMAKNLSLTGFVAFLEERKNARLIVMRLETCGYRRLSNPDEAHGRWVIDGTRTGVFVRCDMTNPEGLAAIHRRKEVA
jgi:hypothetical protein